MSLIELAERVERASGADREFGKWDCVPTHWRPLPTPPAKGTPHV